MEVAWIKNQRQPGLRGGEEHAPIDQPVSEINFDEVQLLGRWDNATSTENFAKLLREKASSSSRTTRW
ncbi:MAG: hypothetical protein R3F17_09035 [Planctomycetota bacterium]